MANDPKPPKQPVTQEDLHAAITELHTAIKGLSDQIGTGATTSIACAECTCGPLQSARFAVRAMSAEYVRFAAYAKSALNALVAPALAARSNLQQ